MSDTSRDPVDHQRTSRPLVGQTLKGSTKAPGVLLAAIGVAAFAICLATFAHRQVGAAITAAVIALLATGAGLAWLAREARRIRELDRKYNINHPRATG